MILRVKILYFFWLLFVVSCSARIEHAGQDNSYLEDLLDKTQLVAEKKCSPFIGSKNIFIGALFPSSSNESCFDMRIFEHEKNLFSDDKLFLQAYPFKKSSNPKNKNLEFGVSATIITYLKDAENEKPLRSKVINSDFIDDIAKSSQAKFFRDHYLRICGLDSDKWQGLQFVLYYNDKKPATAISITRILLPTSLEQFEGVDYKSGDGLAAYHPANQWKDALEKEDINYKTFLGYMCSRR